MQERIRDGTDKWENVAEDMRQLSEEILGKTSGKTKQETENWWWDDKVQKTNICASYKEDVRWREHGGKQDRIIRQEEASQENSRCG